mgnify:FL=1
MVKGLESWEVVLFGIDLNWFLSCSFEEVCYGKNVVSVFVNDVCDFIVFDVEMMDV